MSTNAPVVSKNEGNGQGPADQRRTFFKHAVNPWHNASVLTCDRRVRRQDKHMRYDAPTGVYSRFGDARTRTESSYWRKAPKPKCNINMRPVALHYSLGISFDDVATLFALNVGF
jgi:hypothetical protein